MAFTYIAHDVASDLSGGADFNYELLHTAGTLSEVVVSVLKAATETSYLFTEPDDPSTGGTSTGTFTLKLNVTVGSTNMSLSPTLSRINSSGAQQSGPITSSTGSLVLNAGVQTWTWTNPALSTWASGDRLRVDLPFVNGAAHATTTVTLGWQTTDSSLLVPWSFAGPIPYSFSVLV